MSDAELDILERVACPSAGACGGQYTANTMACVSEAIGLALPNSSGAPAPYESRDAFCVASGAAAGLSRNAANGTSAYSSPRSGRSIQLRSRNSSKPGISMPLA